MATQFVKYFRPLTEALKQLGNSGKPSEVYEIIQKDMNLTDDQIDEQMASGGSRFENQVQWARFYLSKAGFIDASKRGVWSLTENGIREKLTDKEAEKIFREVHSSFSKGREKDNKIEDSEESIGPDESVSVDTDYSSALLETIRDLTASGFEQLCQRLLREAGFQKVEVTGRSNDGGIDGKGLLQINPLVSIPVVFQSKKYNANKLVDVSQVRDLRGAMEGRAEKGILITTSRFTSSAKTEAQREGATPIELVDGEKLVSMFVDLQLGLKSKTTYEIDEDFFDDFPSAKRAKRKQ